MLRLLLTTTSFQDTPGAHHAALDALGADIIRARGPLTEARLLELLPGCDAVICGDDAFTARVLEASSGRLRVISKYGIGLDKIDLGAAARLGIPVLFTPGVNHTTVAEHAFGLLLALRRGIVDLAAETRAGRWTRVTGNELLGSHLGIVGLGRIGREVAIRARAFGIQVSGFGNHWDDAFARANDIRRYASIDDLLPDVDALSLHTRLTPETRGMLDATRLARMRRTAVIINCARGELVDASAVAAALSDGRLAGYAADVLDAEPPPADHPLLHAPRCIITPHVGSRTHENVQRQAGMAVQNLALFLAGKEPLARAPAHSPGPNPSPAT